MKLGLLTAAFPDLTLEEIAIWAHGNGFAALEIACWPSSGSEHRRYAGVAHIDVHDFNPKAVRKLFWKEVGLIGATFCLRQKKARVAVRCLQRLEHAGTFVCR